MIISKTPLRISFVGGGSDLPAFSRYKRGAVISTSINKYIYVNVNRKFDDGVRLSYSRTEEVQSVDAIQHSIVRESLKSLGIRGGIEITTIADIPSTGTGLGSSSAFTVGLVHALSAYQGKYISASKLAADACSIEIDMCKEPIGKQDHYASSVGGFNFIEFMETDEVLVSPLLCKAETIEEIEKSVLMFYTGISRSATQILKEQSNEIATSENKRRLLESMVTLAYKLKDELQSNNTAAIGEILHENWMLKKSIVNGISTQEIDDWYHQAINAGALGGKILGAGAGGFLMFYAPPNRHERIKRALSSLRSVPVAFDKSGSRIIFYN